jgi:hypothetical protein
MDPSAYILADGQYDVGAIVRAMSHYYVTPSPHRVTKENMARLVAELRRFTESIPGEPAIANDLQAWRDRLGVYALAVEEAPEGRSEYLGDHVGDPLLVGWYPEGMVQKPADIATPFSLANQAKVGGDFRKENLRRLVDEIKERSVIATAGLGLWVIAAAVVYFVVVK